LARKPNYSFERMERERMQAAKAAAKAAAKREQQEKDRAEAQGAADPSDQATDDQRD